MFIERIIIAQELRDQQPQLMDKLLIAIGVLETDQNSNIAIETIEHEVFKLEMDHCHASIRTGECTPFANIILYAGVPFWSTQESTPNDHSFRARRRWKVIWSS